MYRKNCYKCYRSSFGSDYSGEWICPVCGEDLTNQKSFHAESFEEVVDKDCYRNSLKDGQIVNFNQIV